MMAIFFSKQHAEVMTISGSKQKNLPFAQHGQLNENGTYLWLERSFSMSV